MPSPLAHSLIGLAIGLIRFLPRYRQLPELCSRLRVLRRELLFCILLANAPDLDYFFGVFQGNLNHYHQTVTHTLIWIVAVALAIWAYGRLRERRAAGLPGSADQAPPERSAQARALRPGESLGLLLTLLGSHLLADWLTVDRSPPIGLMLAWPFSAELYHASFAFFPHPAKQTLAALWSFHNLRLLLVETAITLPLVAGVVWLKHRRMPGKFPLDS